MASEEQILACLEESLKKLPQVIYLNNVVKNVLDEITASNHITVILSYFFHCNNCKNYFEENDIKKCVCKDKIWCKFCYEINICSGRCEMCPENIINLNNYHTLRCIFPGCINKALYGNITHALYCSFHISDSLIVDHTSVCEITNCCSSAPFLDYDGWNYCNRHKNKTSVLHLREGATYKHSIPTSQCHVCKCSTIIIYKCGGCNTLRCGNCAQFELFRIHGESSFFYNIYCCNCISCYTIESALDYFSFHRYSFCVKCSDIAYYYDDNTGYQYCDNHYISECVKINNMSCCEFPNCYVLASNIYCRFHNELKKKFN